MTVVNLTSAAPKTLVDVDESRTVTVTGGPVTYSPMTNWIPQGMSSLTALDHGARQLAHMGWHGMTPSDSGNHPTNDATGEKLKPWADYANKSGRLVPGQTLTVDWPTYFALERPDAPATLTITDEEDD